MTTVVQRTPSAGNIRNVLHDGRWRPYFAFTFASSRTVRSTRPHSSNVFPDRVAVPYELQKVVPADGDDVFVLYEYELQSGERYRNTELTVRDGRVVQTKVFFRGRVTA